MIVKVYCDRMFASHLRATSGYSCQPGFVQGNKRSLIDGSVSQTVSDLERIAVDDLRSSVTGPDPTESFDILLSRFL